MAKAENFDKWVSGPSQSRLGRTCCTCAYGPEVKEIIRRFMEKRISGETRKRNSELYRWLCDNYGYNLRENTLGGHMRRCEPELYKQLRTADIKNGLALGPSKIDENLGRYKGDKTD